MAIHLLQRLLGTLGVLFSMSVLIFAVVHILPGNVAYAILGEYATPDRVAVLEAKLGLNDPLPLQYWRWLDGMLHGDLGASLVMARPAAPLILEALERSAILAGLAFILVASGGIALGIYTATRQGRMPDKIATLAQFIFIAIPDFFWAILGVLTFAAWLHVLPATGYAPLDAAGVLVWASHLVLPVLVLSFGLVAHVSRLTRSSMIEVLQSRYILAARAKGMSDRRVLWRHALPNALLPAITILAVDLGLLIGGIVVIETVFAYPGLGRLLVFAIEHHDLPLLQAGMMVVTATYASANLVADLGYAVLNPRIRVGSAAA
ncbi:MAG: peptide/nickel transport system permease protein [Acetobacteraceae bacterium]|nr:Peptide/nickel transport system permease protein [Rhodopila sp.]MEA2770522.1 peptide/nickel transport system permease protein [Acetobacteraceae bacterium]